MVQQVEQNGQDDQQYDRYNGATERAAIGRLARYQSFGKHLDCLQCGASAQYDRNKDRDLERVKYQAADVQFRHGIDDILPETLPVGNNECDDRDQRSEPEQHVGKADTGNVRQQIGFERCIKI